MPDRPRRVPKRWCQSPPWSAGWAAAGAMLTEHVAHRVSDHVPRGRTHQGSASRRGGGRPPSSHHSFGTSSARRLAGPPRSSWPGLQRGPAAVGWGGHRQRSEGLPASEGRCQMFVLGIIIRVRFRSNQRVLGNGVNRLIEPVLHSG